MYCTVLYCLCTAHLQGALPLLRRICEEYASGPAGPRACPTPRAAGGASACLQLQQRWLRVPAHHGMLLAMHRALQVSQPATVVVCPSNPSHMRHSHCSNKDLGLRRHVHEARLCLMYTRHHHPMCQVARSCVANSLCGSRGTQVEVGPPHLHRT